MWHCLLFFLQERSRFRASSAKRRLTVKTNWSATCWSTNLSNDTSVRSGATQVCWLSETNCDIHFAFFLNVVSMNVANPHCANFFGPLAFMFWIRNKGSFTHVPSASPFLWAALLIFLTLCVNNIIKLHWTHFKRCEENGIIDGTWKWTLRMFPYYSGYFWFISSATFGYWLRSIVIRRLMLEGLMVAHVCVSRLHEGV